MEIDKNDLSKLEHLLNELRNSSFVYPDSLNNFFDKKDVEKEFNRLGAILIKLDVCNYNQISAGNITLYPNENTFIFNFKKYITEHNQKEYKENLELQLAKSNIEANEINAKNSNFNKKATIINIIIGILNVGLILWQVSK